MHRMRILQRRCTLCYFHLDSPIHHVYYFLHIYTYIYIYIYICDAAFHKLAPDGLVCLLSRFPVLWGAVGAGAGLELLLEAGMSASVYKWFEHLVDSFSEMDSLGLYKYCCVSCGYCTY